MTETDSDFKPLQCMIWHLKSPVSDAQMAVILKGSIPPAQCAPDSAKYPKEYRLGRDLFFGNGKVPVRIVVLELAVHALDECKLVVASDNRQDSHSLYSSSGVITAG